MNTEDGCYWHGNKEDKKKNWCFPHNYDIWPHGYPCEICGKKNTKSLRIHQNLSMACPPAGLKGYNPKR